MGVPHDNEVSPDDTLDSALRRLAELAHADMHDDEPRPANVEDSVRRIETRMKTPSTQKE